MGVKALLLSMTVFLCGVVSVHGQEPKGITLTDSEKELVKKNNGFALNLFREARGEESQVLSPLSITYALGMLNNGAAGKTQQEINDVLGFGDAGADAINAFCRKLLTESGNVDKETKVKIANTIYVNKPYELEPSFVEKVNEYYDATPETRDFHDGQTMDVINQWASDHTEGMIKEILNEDNFNPYAVSYLLNAIYFKGGWVFEFDAANTREEPFNGGSNVMMMWQKSLLPYDANETYQVVHLPYGNGAYWMSVFLPQKGKTIDEVIERIKELPIVLMGGTADVDLKLPRMKIETHINLKDIMCALGMPRAFDSFLAEFPYFCKDNDPAIYIGRMRQVAKMEVDEKGTEAAAVTIIEGRMTGIPKSVTFHADRPFVYVISEKSSGAIFFIGQYMGDAKATSPDRIANVEASSLEDVPLYNLNGQRMERPVAKGLYIQQGKKYIIK
jgi:serpin B